MTTKHQNIKLTYDPPPIPDRQHDWRAIRANYDLGHPVGFGATPIAALSDLLEQEQERDQ